jgi:Fe-S oxidoreductase
MVDEREGEVKKEDLPFAFNRQSLWARTAIVAAGPLFNLGLAVALFWTVLVIGETGIKPILGVIEPGTIAQESGFAEGDEIVSSDSKATPTCADDPAWLERAAALGARTYELSDFLVTVAKLDKLPGDFTGTVTYHDSCSGLRELGVKAQPRALLAKLPGVTLTEMNGAEECCGFGGTFSVKFGDISARIAEKKCDNIRASGADAVVLGDLGCMLSIEGKLRRLGDEKTKVLHIAEILSGEQ